MKALVYTAPSEVTFRDEPEPVAGAGDVMLEVEAAGICGSDMHAFHGRDPRRNPPLILGHELAARIIDGPGAGRRVTVNPLITCGRCDYCVTGRDNLCSSRTMIGMTRPGGFAERIAVPERTLIEIPGRCPTRAAALTEPAATALHALSLAMRALAQTLAGGATDGDRRWCGRPAVGAARAIVRLPRGHARRDQSAASRGGESGGRSARPRAGRAGGAHGKRVDLVIDAVGAKATRNAALVAVRPGGVIVHIGLADWASEIDMRKLTLSEITLIGTYTYSSADLHATVAALHAGAFGSLGWVEERSLAAGAAAFADLDAGRSGSAKILLRPN